MRAAVVLVLVATLVLGSLAPVVAWAAEFGGAVSLGDGTTMGGLDELRRGKAALDWADQKLESRLLSVRGLPTGGVLDDPRRPPPWRRGDNVRVTVRVDALDDATRAALGDAGLDIERESSRRPLVEGWVPAGRLRALAALDGVRSVRAVDRGQTRVTSAGDVASRANLARGLGVTGSGVRVGVISDGIDGAASAIAAGELPGQPAVPAGCETAGGSEGTAMLEIVHDLAPDATLFFASGVASPMKFVEAVQCLTAAGVDVIVDDLGFFGEPYFEDGDVADAVRTAVQAGVSYHTAAGNAAQLHYEGDYRDSPQSNFHNFISTGSAVDNTNGVAIPPGGSLLCVLQWDDPFGSADDDYDLLLVDQSRNVIAASRTPQNGQGDPVEIVVHDNSTGTTELAGLVIERSRGATRTLELFCVRDVTGMEYVTPGSSIFGQAAVPEAITVAAVAAADPGLDTVERFSSQGPARLAFPPATRPKPDLAGFDGVDTSVPGFAPFLGTSAAAPHTAAIAALMLQRNPFLTPADLQGILAATAVDIGPPGFDAAAGAGRVDALAAVAETPLPCAADADCNDGDPCTTDRCEAGRCAAPGSCDDGNPCNGVETCQPEAGGCVPGVQVADGTPCPDGTLCNGDETCLGGLCTAGTPLVCADGDTCTQDVCTPEGGCQFVALEGVASVRCVLDRGLPVCPGVDLPASLRKRFARAQRLVDRAEAAQRRRKQRVLVRKAARTLKRAVAAVERARDLPADCASTLAVSLSAARDQARAVAQALR
jgi:subtilisin family serine protease